MYDLYAYREEIIQGVMNTPTDDHPDDSCVLQTVSSKEVFQAIVTLNNYLLQHEKKLPNVVYALQKIKDEVEFNLGTKKRQTTLDAYFER